ncbi:hypothetical protein GOP47_0004332 [Adiantum capillus-veneris]|uniref:Uncharacterized protein n=1 Tax=Adiantum capillus-veneris TaxID=13818 RepID=A0A9D4V7C9_ADICA|nr:hypothetical protein GOP47_0004332 [Adiantum capillus-veneris]
MVVLSSSDGKGETMLAPQRISQRRRRQRRQRSRVPSGTTVSVISSDSNEEGTDVDISVVVQGFATLNIGEKGAGEKHLVNVEVQTEISIPPKVFVEPSMVDRVLSRTCGVPKNQAKQQEIHVAYFPPLNQPIISKEDTTLLLNKTASKKKVSYGQTSEEDVGTSAAQKNISRTQTMIFGQPCKATSPTRPSACIHLEGSVKLMCEKLGLMHEVEPLPLPNDTPSSVAPFPPCEPHCPPSHNTRSKAKKKDSKKGV